MKKALSQAWGGTHSFRPVLGIIILLVILFSLWQPAFRTSLNVQNIISSVSVIWILAMGETFVLISGGFDLSVGANAAFCGIFLAKMLEATAVPGPLVVVLAILVGAIVGAVMNGIFIGYLRLSVFVVTLASMTTLTGVVLVWTNTQSLYLTKQIAAQIATTHILGIQTLIWIMVILFAIFLYVQKWTHFGRDIYATGGSYVAARLSGIRTQRTLVLVYAVAGACAGLAGVVAVGRVGAATPQVDLGGTLNAVAAVLLGGTALTGGAGSVIGTVFGCLFIGVLQNGLNLAGFGSSWQYVVTGVILLMSVLGGRIGGSRLGLFSGAKKAFGHRSGEAVAPSAGECAEPDSSDDPKTR